ncbi:MAG TPA: ComEC/Rec2 family competence protein [Gaiellales bacterium]|nr:ComEC/Rec2 family competence protein [Gaiellales bacterium]
MTPDGRIDELGTVAAPWLAAGLAAPALAASGPPGLALIAVAPFLLVLRTGRLGLLASAAAMACALSGAAWSAHGLAARAADPLAARVGHVERARLVVEGQPRAGPFGSSAIARMDGHPVELRAPGPLEQGAIVEASGSLAAVRPSSGGFDRRTWLARQGVHETLNARSLTQRGRRGGIQGVLDRLRHGARAALRAGGDDEATRIATGVALGGSASLSDRTVEDFRASGLAHLLAVSGGNVVLLVAAVLGLAWLAALPRPLAHGLAIPAVIAYAAIVGGGPSVVRAAATGALASLAWLIGSARDPWHLLALAAAAVLALDPWAVVGPGFQLSFVAVAAIHGLAPRIRAWLEGTAVPLRLCAPLAISLACTLGTAPVALVHFGRTSLVASLPANLLALPAVAPLLWLALAACALWPVAPGAAAVVDAAVRALGAYIGLIARFGAWLDEALPGRALLVALAGGALAWVVLKRPAAVLAGGLAGLLLALAWPSARASPPPPRALRVTFLDVGQGDAALIEAPGLRALVDTGPPAAKVERQLRKRGVDSLDALVLSHDQSDHDGRAAAIVRSLHVALLVTPALPGRSASLADALAAARARDTRVVRGRAGLVLRSGAAELRILGPRRFTLATSPNDAALIVQARQGSCSFLLPADAESPVLLTDRLAPVGVLNVSHHGSDDSRLARLLAQLRPRLAVISVGAHNTYGHPAATTLATLAQAGVPVRRTDREGDIALACGTGG